MLERQDERDAFSRLDFEGLTIAVNGGKLRQNADVLNNLRWMNVRVSYSFNASRGEGYKSTPSASNAKNRDASVSKLDLQESCVGGHDHI